MIQWLMLSMILRVNEDCILTMMMERTNVLQGRGSRMILDTSVLSTTALKATSNSSRRSSK